DASKIIRRMPLTPEKLGLVDVPNLETATEILARFRDELEPVDRALAQLVSSGNVKDAAAAFEGLALQARSAGLTHEELIALFPEYHRQLERHKERTDDATTGQSAFKRETQVATQAIKDQHEELRGQTDPGFAFQRAPREGRAAQADWTDATKKHGPKSDEAREAALRLFEAVTDLNGAAGDVSGTFKGEWTPEMQAAAVAAGLTEDQIADLKRIVEDTRTAAEDYATTRSEEHTSELQS